VPLPRELEILTSYLDIERVRFGPRLSIAFDVAADAESAQVPPLILQPIVENAIKHGIAPHTAPGRLVVAARREREVLQLRVTDSGRGMDGEALGGEGRGLELTRRRLEATYPGAHALAFSRQDDGFTVELRFPADGPSHG